jgi:hypothetical protein
MEMAIESAKLKITVKELQALLKDVGKEESVYRSVEEKRINYEYADGKVRLASAAFFDSQEKPSLYRHLLCESPPESNPPHMSETDAVYVLIVNEIEVGFTFKSGSSPKKQETISYLPKVVSDTSEEQHISHSIVVCKPSPWRISKDFDRLREILAVLANRREPPIPPRKEFLDEYILT